MLASLIFNNSFVLVANNPACNNRNWYTNGRVIRFNHCDNTHLFGGRTDVLVLSGKGKNVYPHGVNGQGHIKCKSYSVNDTVLWTNQAARVPVHTPLPLIFSTRACPISNCSIGLETIHQLLLGGASNVTLIGFSNHIDQWNVSWHNFPRERQIVNELVAKRRIRRVPCLSTRLNP